MSEHDEVVALYLRLLRGWNDRNAQAMAACFSDDATMIGFDGSLAEGGRPIEEHLSPIFADHPTVAYVALIRTIQKVGKSVAILRADVGMVPPGAGEINSAANARQIIVARAGEGGWQIQHFQNTPAALHWDDAGREALSADLNAALAERGHLPKAWPEASRG